MDAISIGLLLLLAAVAGNILARISSLPLPVPLVHIAVGALLAATFGVDIALDPDTFFPLFIATLLFLDGLARLQRGSVPRQGNDPDVRRGAGCFHCAGRRLPRSEALKVSMSGNERGLGHDALK